MNERSGSDARSRPSPIQSSKREDWFVEMPSAPGSRVLLLDLDGTIADTLPHIFNAYRHAVAEWVTTPPTDAEVEATFGPAERDCLALMVPEESVDLAESRFHAYYESGLERQVRLAEGMDEVIGQAQQLGWKVGVFTGKGRRSARFTLIELGLWDQIEVLVSSDDVQRPKPDSEGVFQASSRLGVPTSHILMVGDSPADVQAGKGAGARTAAALWAAFKPDRLKEAGADFLCESIPDLIEAIKHLDDES